MEIFTESGLIALGKVLMIDLVLAGDNAIVIGMVAARVQENLRAKVIMWGMALAVILRVLFSVSAVYLLQIIGLTLAGGILLLWVSWRLYRDIREQKEEDVGAEVVSGDDEHAATPAQPVPFRQAIFQIAVADVSMSLDNVLAVAGAARDHITVLVIGLILSITFMGAAATVVARLLQRYHWLSYIGLVLILYVACEMIYHGGHEVAEVM